MDIEIKAIYPDYLYSTHFSGCYDNEYETAFTRWNDLDYLIRFFEENASSMKSAFWTDAGYDRLTPEELTNKIIDDAEELEDYIDDIVRNSSMNITPDLDSFFEPLGGDYSDMYELVPSKAYGRDNPSMLRLYAIRIESNCYLIVHGGIKLGDSIQHSPILKDELFRKINNTIDFLEFNDIKTREDLRN